MTHNEHRLAIFKLIRDEDPSGVSGTGHVATGVLFPHPNACVVLGWLTDINSIAVYETLEDLRRVHGHEGQTRIEWITTNEGVPNVD